MGMIVMVTIYPNVPTKNERVVVVWQGMHYSCNLRDLTYIGNGQYTVDIDKLKVYAGEYDQ